MDNFKQTIPELGLMFRKHYQKQRRKKLTRAILSALIGLAIGAGLAYFCNQII